MSDGDRWITKCQECGEIHDVRSACSGAWDPENGHMEAAGCRTIEEKLLAEVGEPSDGHDLADEAIGLIRVARQQRDDAERRLLMARTEAAADRNKLAESRDKAVAEVIRLRAAGQAVVEAWTSCREANSMQGFWTILDDLAAELDGRAALRRGGCICELGPVSAVPSQSCPLHGHGPIPGRRG